MTKEQLLREADEQGLAVRLAPTIPVPAPRRWAYVADGEHAHVLYIVEGERVEVRRRWREARKRQFVYEIRVHLAKGPKEFRGRVRAMTPGTASFAAVREVRSQLERKRVSTWEIRLTAA